MAFWTQILDQFTLHQNRIRWILLGVCGFAMVCAIGGLTWYFFFQGDAPDPNKASLAEVEDYIASDRFLNASSQERGQYVNQLMNRYKTMNYTEQEDARKRFGTIFRKDKKARKTFWLSYAQNQSKTYCKLSPDQRRRHIDTILSMAELVEGRNHTKNEFRQKGFVQQKSLTTEQKKKTAQRMRNNLPMLLKTTTSTDRARMLKMGRDIMKQAHERYER